MLLKLNIDDILFIIVKSLIDNQFEGILQNYWI